MALSPEARAAMLARLQGKTVVSAPAAVIQAPTIPTVVTIQAPATTALPLALTVTTSLTDSILDAPVTAVTAPNVVTLPAAVAVGVTGNSINVLELQAKIAELSDALLTAHPMLPVLLRTIHTQLRKDPELVTLLADEDIGVIVSGLMRQTNTELVIGKEKATKSETAATKKKLVGISVDDL